MLFGAPGEDRGDAGYAQFGGLFDGPFEVIELEDGKQQVDGERGLRFEFFVQGEPDFGVLIAACGANFGDFGAMEEAVGDQIEDLAGLGAEDTGQVVGLLANEGGVGGVAGLRGPRVCDPASSSHKDSCELQVTGCQLEARWGQGLGMVTVNGPWW